MSKKTPLNDLPSEITIKLRKPLDSGDGVMVTQITLREPTLDEMERVQKDSEKFGGPAAMKSLMGTQNNLPPAVFGAMSARDFKEADGYIGRFFESSPMDGETE